MASRYLFPQECSIIDVLQGSVYASASERHLILISVTNADESYWILRHFFKHCKVK